MSINFYKFYSENYRNDLIILFLHSLATMHKNEKGDAKVASVSLM
ncbi:hypothetical protein CEV31_3026 [Brucella thiophenivorans]|uniref:Uncharacterized protein n=1 Tax=Brucella thiophenivorans TaxID=571255 RepID=A0A256FJF5_9HYPH|nr:hypothetical protein CEV31_3026 [Brucella thiophenivorans]